MSLIRDYFEKTTLYQSQYGKNTIVLMQVGAFFEVYGLQNKVTNIVSGSQIIDFGRICDLNVVDKKQTIDNSKLVFAGFILSGIDKYVKKLQEGGFTSVIFGQNDGDKNDSITRSLIDVVSPGTYFSADDNHITNNTVCIWVNITDNVNSIINKMNKMNKSAGSYKKITVGIASIDIYTGKTSIFEFTEMYVDGPTTFDELDRFISIYNPSEVILIGNISDKEMNNIISYANIQCKSIHKIMGGQPFINCEKQTYQKTVLERFYTIKDFSVFCQNFYEYTIATQAFVYLLDFIYQHNPNLTHNIAEPIFENCSDRVMLANHSLKQLNIIDDHVYTGKYSSVNSMLNVCVTAMGKRQFAYNLVNPTTNIRYLEQEYNMTEHLLQCTDNNAMLLLSDIKDIAKINRQLFMKKISPKTISQFYKNLSAIKEINEVVLADPVFNTYILEKSEEYAHINTYCDTFLELINKNVEVSLCEEIDVITQFETNFIRPGINKQLDDSMHIFNDSLAILESMRKYFDSRINSMLPKTGKTIAADYVKIHETEKNSHGLIATKRRCAILKNALSSDSDHVETISYESSDYKVPSLFIFKCSVDTIHFTPQSTANNFISSAEIDKICGDIVEQKHNMKDLILSSYLTFIEQFKAYQTEFACIISYITLIDIVYAKMTIAKKYNYCKPTVVISGAKSFVDIKNIRHCLIEHIQQNELYVTNDVMLGTGNTNESATDTILLYGTNAVGKTSLIRAIGIVVIMAQAGLYVPCSSFRFSPYKQIFTRILGDDNIFKGLSTFAVEMSELRTILRLADQQSLILGDELCSGTESVSAISIFVAGIEQLHNIGSSSIFATHLHEIVKFEEVNALTRLAMKHMTVRYDKERDLLIYDRMLKDGPGDNMYGLEVCKALNLPAEFLDRAHAIRRKYNPETGSILSLKTSHYNSKKVMGLCEKCNKAMGTEVHHLQHQQAANEAGVIINAKTGSVFHKNKEANLVTLCEQCHNAIHKQKGTHKKVKTSKGIIIINN